MGCPFATADMEYYFGADWRGTVVPTRATAKYVARVREVAKDSPHLLIAHQYTRYLGDLFGGQMMGGMATRSLGLEDGEGIAFYNFEVGGGAGLVVVYPQVETRG